MADGIGGYIVGIRSKSASMSMSMISFRVVAGLPSSLLAVLVVSIGVESISSVLV